MKVTANKAEFFVKSPDKNISVFLLYGPDKGKVRDFMAKLLAAHGLSLSDSFSVTNLSIEDVRSNPSSLFDEVQGFSLLAEERMVIVDELTDSDKGLVQGIIDEQEKLTVPLILIAGNLSGKSTLRKICENSPVVAAIPAYADDEKSLPGYIKSYFQEQGKSISTDATFFLSQQLGTDRGITRQELTKILVYVGDKSAVDLDDVQAMAANESGFFLDDLLYAVMDGKTAEIDRLYEAAQENAVQPSIILMMLSRQVSRLHSVKSLVDHGTAVDRAIIMTGGPLFWKIGDRFKQQMRSWSGDQLQDITRKLVEATKSCRLNLGVEEAICQRTLMAVAASSPLRRR